MVPHTRPRTRFIRVDLQLEIVFVSLLVACLLLLVEYQLGIAALWSVAARVSDELTIATFRNVLLRTFVLSVGLGLSLAVLVGLIWSFRVCAPLRRLRGVLAEMNQGNWRKASCAHSRDGLQDVRDEVEGARRVACDFADEAYRVLREAKELLSEIPQTDDALADRVARIGEEVVRVEDAYDRHFAEPIGSAEEAEADTANAVELVR